MKRIMFLTGMLLPIFCYAQGVDSTARSKFVTTSPRLGGITITDIIAPVNANGSNFTMQRPIVDVGIPLYKDFSTVHTVLIKTGVRYDGLFLSNEKQIGSDNFQALTIPLLVSYSLSRSTNISFVGLVTVGSDFKRNIDASDILYVAGVRIGFHPSKSFRYGVTLTYVSNYSGKFFIPLPDIDWTISNRWSLTGVIPARASFKYKLSESQLLGVTAALDGSMYRLNEGAQDQYVHLRQNSAGLIYELKLGQRWKLNLIAGHTFMQRLETFNLDQKVPFDGFNKLNDRIFNISYRQNSFTYQGGISYQF